MKYKEQIKKEFRIDKNANIILKEKNHLEDCAKWRLSRLGKKSNCACTQAVGKDYR